MPGFGFSYPNSSFDFSMQACVAVIAHVIEKLSVGPATLMLPCAWSYVAFKLATEQPALVEKLIVSQCPCWDEEQAWTKRIDIRGLMGTPVMGQLFLAVNQKKVSDGWYDIALPPGQPKKDFAEPARKVLSDGGIFCLASLIQTWFDVKNPSFRVEQPTVVMWGGSDRTHRHSNSNSVLKYLLRGKVVNFPGAGHFPELENPERLKNLLSDEDLWISLRSYKSSRSTGDEGHRMGDTEDKESGIVRIKDCAGDPEAVIGRRKPYDSHL